MSTQKEKKIISTDTPLLAAVQQMFPDSSTTTVRSLIKQGRTTINGRIEKDVKTIATAGSELIVWPKIMPIKNELQLVFEDQHMIVVNKPVGLLSVAANYEPTASAHGYLKEHYRPGRVFVVHRLDREVSGLMLFARTETGLEALKNLLESRNIKRMYAAIVEGILEKEEGSWESYLVEDEEYFVKSTALATKGEFARTYYKVVKTSTNHSQLEIALDTGKKNQIRVHCTEAGHPVVGDKKYGAKTNPVRRLCLHSYRLELTHPVTGKLLSFETPLPEEFFQCMEG